jgi:hypothetical protein
MSRSRIWEDGSFLPRLPIRVIDCHPRNEVAREIDVLFRQLAIPSILLLRATQESIGSQLAKQSLSRSSSDYLQTLSDVNQTEGSRNLSENRLLTTVVGDCAVYNRGDGPVARQNLSRSPKRCNSWWSRRECDYRLGTARRLCRGRARVCVECTYIKDRLKSVWTRLLDRNDGCSPPIRF